jgi:hypothetical protein
MKIDSLFNQNHNHLLTLLFFDYFIFIVLLVHCRVQKKKKKNQFDVADAETNFLATEDPVSKKLRIHGATLLKVRFQAPPSSGWNIRFCRFFFPL